MDQGFEHDERDFATPQQRRNRKAIIQDTSNYRTAITSLWNLLFLAHFPFDGYDPTTSEITYPNNPVDFKSGYSLRRMMLAAFFGLPSRPEAFYNENNVITPQLTFSQLVKNFFGGIDWAPDTGLEKKGWQLILSPIKIGIILPLKILSFPFKFLLNTVKLLALVILPTLTRILYTLFSFLYMASWYLPPIINLIFIILTGIALFASWLLDIAVIKIFAPAIQLLIAPLANAKAFFHNTYLIVVLLGGGEGLATVLGSMSGLINITLSLVLWALFLPFLISAIITVFPAVLTAVAFVSHLPLITATLSLLNGLSLSASIGAFFAPKILYIAGLIGVHLSTAILPIATAASLGFFATLIAIPSSYIADKFSDYWASWHNGGPLTWLFSRSQSRNKPGHEESARNHTSDQLREMHDLSPEAESPSVGATQCAAKQNQFEKSALDSNRQAELTRSKITRPANCTTTEKQTPMQPPKFASSRLVDTTPDNRSNDFN